MNQIHMKTSELGLLARQLVDRKLVRERVALHRVLDCSGFHRHNQQFGATRGLVDDTGVVNERDPLIVVASKAYRFTGQLQMPQAH